MNTPARTYDPTKVYTADEALRLRGAGRWDLIDGKIVEKEAVTKMDWTGDDHAGIEINIGAELREYARTTKSGKVRGGEIGIYLQRNPDKVRGADVLYISNERYAQKKSSSALDVAPELVVEIMSPDDSWSEVTEKIRDYFAIGVRLVWIADPKLRNVFAYRSLTDVSVFTENDTLTGDDVLPGFSVKVAQLFEI